LAKRAGPTSKAALPVQLVDTDASWCVPAIPRLAGEPTTAIGGRDGDSSHVPPERRTAAQIGRSARSLKY